MNFFKIIFCLLSSSFFTIAHAEPTTAPKPNAPASAAIPAIKPSITPAAIKPMPATAATASAAALSAAPTAAANTTHTAADTTLVQAPVITLEQRRQQELLINAERIDKANRELLAKNQELQVQNENMVLQNNVLKRDKSSEGIWRGAFAVIAGFLMGWYFSSSSRRKSNW